MMAATLVNSKTVLDTIGNTPLIKLQAIVPVPHVNVFLKLEYCNPGLSIKDRIVKYIVDEAENEGLLKPGGTLIENTSGNTGAAVAMLAAIRGYRAILTMPAKVSIEKQNNLKVHGAEMIICPSEAPPQSPEHYINVAKRLADQIPNSFRIDQYDNPKNISAHYLTTGPEIWRQMEGEIDYFISGAGTGGTISGVGRYLKEQNPNIQIVMPDPIGSVFYPYFKTGKIPEDANCGYLMEGFGNDQMSKALDLSVVDHMLPVTDRDAFLAGRELAAKEGLLTGGSTGANIWAALQVARKLSKPANIVTIAPDSGIKYLSKMYNDSWMREHQMLK